VIAFNDRDRTARLEQTLEPRERFHRLPEMLQHEADKNVIERLRFERQRKDIGVLEHLGQPMEALTRLKRLLKPGGTVTVIEGDHGSTYFHPDSLAARAVIQCQITLQHRAGGNALIGRQLYPLMNAAGFSRVRVSPRIVYADSSRPDLVDGFTRKTFTAMIEGVRTSAISAGLITPEDFDDGIRDLHRTTQDDGVFCYTFFKGVGQN
jgi:hypothetical protein